MTRVSAVLAASALDSTVTPYRSLRSAPRSGRRTVTASWAGRRAGLRTPDSSASPILPAPIIAIISASLPRLGLAPVPHQSASHLLRGGDRRPGALTGHPGRPLLGGPGQGAQEEHQVRRAFGQPPHHVAVPLVAVGKAAPNLGADPREPLLLLGTDAVEHLVLEP